MSLVWGTYRLVAPLIGATAPALRLVAGAEERRLWDERLGRVAAQQDTAAWIHAASLGEALGVGPLVAELARARPGARFHLTAMTRSGRARLRSIDPGATLAPLDAPGIVRRFLEALDPTRLLIVETELWPHWLIEARRRGIPAAVVSARLSPRSLVGYRRLGAPLTDLVGGLGGVLCQSEEDRARWLMIGSRPERTVVTGNLKSDALPLPAPNRALARASLGLDPDRPLLVLGSVRPGEVRTLALAWRAIEPVLADAWQVAAIPRHPRASAELRAEAREAGQALVAGRAPHAGAWLWDERPGILLDYYLAADVAFVGGTLGAYGGHNPLEPAACGAAVLIGPHHEAQRPAVRALLARGAVQIVPATPRLTPALAALLASRETRATMAASALAVVAAERGVARRTVEQLVAWELWPPR